MDPRSNRRSSSLSAIAALGLCVVLLGASAVVAEERDDDPPERDEQDKQEKQEKTAERADGEKIEPGEKKEEKDDVFVFTNDDLENRYGSPEPARPAAVPARGALKGKTPSSTGPGEDPAKSGDGTGKPADGMAEDDTAARRAALEAEIARLRKREASLRNPFLPREQSTDEEKEREAGKDNVSRLREVQQRIRELEQELRALD